MLHHLADDDLDVLIVDVNALQTVDLLDFTDQVVLGGDGTLDGQNILGISVAFGQQSTLGDDVALHDLEALTERDQVALGDGCAVLVHAVDLGMAGLLGIVDVDGTADLGHDSHGLRAAALEQFLNTRKTLGDIVGRCDTAGMEGTHGQLGTGLADGLGSDDTDSLADR